MVTSRVSTLAQQQLVTSNALRTQRNVNDLQVQIASGKKRNPFPVSPKMPAGSSI